MPGDSVAYGVSWQRAMVQAFAAEAHGMIARQAEPAPGDLCGARAVRFYRFGQWQTNTFCGHPRLKVDIPYRGSQGPLHLLIDSPGIKVEGISEWNVRKHGRKNNLGIDGKTPKTMAVEFTRKEIDDAPMLHELLDRIPPQAPVARCDLMLGPVRADAAARPKGCYASTVTICG